MINIFLFTSLALSSVSVTFSVDIVYTAPALWFIEHPPILFREASILHYSKGVLRTRLIFITEANRASRQVTLTLCS